MTTELRRGLLGSLFRREKAVSPQLSAVGQNQSIAS
jgi:hypothetical protein